MLVLLLFCEIREFLFNSLSRIGESFLGKKSMHQTSPPSLCREIAIVWSPSHVIAIKVMVVIRDSVVNYLGKAMML